MKKIANFIVKQKFLILIITLLLMIPSILGYILTDINYDILVYLPSDIETLKGEKILTDDFKMGAFSIVITDNMKSKDIIKLEDEIRSIDTVEKVISLNDLTGTNIPINMLPSEVTSRLAKDDSSLILVTFSNSTSDDDTLKAVEKMRDIVSEETKIGGMSAMVLDTKILFNSEMLLYVVIAVILCIIVLELSLDSFIVPFLLMANIGIAILFNMGSNIFLGNISYITKAIAAVLQLGVTTDFSIFLYHKYEKLKKEKDNNEEAMSKAIVETFTSVLGSSLTTIAGFLALCTMQLTLGVDIGIVMAKGVLIGVICVLTVFPALLLIFDKQIEKKKHKELLPEFTKLKEFVLKHYIIIFIIFITLLIPAYLAQKKTEVYYKLDSSIPSNYGYSKATNTLIEDYGLVSQEMLIIPKSIPDYKIDEMVEKINELDGIDKVLNPNSLSKYGINNLLSEDIKKIYETDKYKMVLILSDYDIATDELNNQVDQVNKIIKDYDNDIILAGEGPLMKDLVNTTDTDFKNVNYTSIGVIFILMMIVLKSISLPILLVTAIEFAIFINMGVPYFTGTKIPFIASVVIGTIQLGATIDYAILTTTKYLEERSKGRDKKIAVKSAMDNSVRSIFVSAMCFFGATIGVGIVSKIDMIGCLCRLISRGAIVSMIVVICIVPSILIIFDKLIIKTTILKKGNGNMKKIIATTLILSFMLTPISTLALTKEETVYSKLESDGKVKSTVVSEHLINSDKEDKLAVLTDLEDIINTGSDSKYTKKDNMLTFDSKGKDIFFQGTTSKELPITTKITYKLDGKDISLEDLLGKKGKVEITIKYINNSLNYVNVNGKVESLYTPFMVATLTSISNENNSNVSVLNGKVIDNGLGYTIIGLSAPGLYESLDFDELKGLDTVKITLDTTKFELASIYSVATPKIIDTSDLNIFEKLKDVTSKVNTLQDSMNKIEDGSKQLKDGSSKLKSGLEEAIAKLSNSDQVTLTDTQKTEIENKAWNEVRNEMITNPDPNLTTVVSNSISDIITTYLTNNGLLSTYMDCVNNQTPASCATINSDANLNLIKQAASTSSQSTAFYVGEKISKKVSVNTVEQTTNEVKNQVLGNIKDSLTTLYQGVEQLDTGINSLSDGITRFNNEGIKTISNVTNKVNQVSGKLEALEELSNNYQSYSMKKDDTKSNTKFISVVEGKNAPKEKQKQVKKEKKKNLWEKFLDLFR